MDRELKRAWEEHVMKVTTEEMRHSHEISFLVDAWVREVTRIRHTPKRGYTKPGIRARIAEAPGKKKEEGVSGC